MKIFIDPGHGGDSIGASYKGRKEQDDCLRLSLAVRDNLLTQKNVEVLMSRTTDVNPAISYRCAEANAWSADYFLSIHRNAFVPNEATGAENWVYSKVSKQGDTYKKAEIILAHLCEATGYKNRGVKLGAPEYADYGVNRLTSMSSCLLEVGFVDSDKDNAIFDSKFEEMAREIAKGVYEANGGKWVEASAKPEEAPAVPETTSKPRFIVQAGAFDERAGADEQVKKLKAAGFDAFVAVKGDMDGDGKITAADAREVLRESVGLN